MQEFMNLLEDLNYVSVSIRLGLSILFAGFIGIERQGRHHPAGLRTHMLVCVGSALTMMLGQYLYIEYQADPSRIGAQVVSGIGFLGVGTIILSGSRVRGITTAAGLWASACMGLAIGAGFYEGALISFFAIAFTLIVVRKISTLYYTRHPRQKQLYVRLRSLSDLLYIHKLLKVWGVCVGEINIENGEEENAESEEKNVVFAVTMGSHIDSDLVMMNLLQEECVIYADYVKKQEKRS